MPTDLLRPAPCAICGDFTPADEIYPANFSPQDLNAVIFSARRLPDRVHYRMVRCRTCGLLRSDPVASPDQLAALYTASRFTYSTEVDSLQATYGAALQRLVPYGLRIGGRVLDVGCGNGFFLEKAEALGYEGWGIEPSAEAVAQAHPVLRGRIRQAMLQHGLFEGGFFAAVCFFQVLDHFSDPLGALKEAHYLLEAGGLVLAINHDVEALQARLLGARSPIVDIEHTYLYSKKTQKRLFEAAGFEVLESFDVLNCYPLSYWLQLFPLPTPAKKVAIAGAKALGLGGLKLALKAGNQGLIGRKCT